MSTAGEAFTTEFNFCCLIKNLLIALEWKKIIITIHFLKGKSSSYKAFG